MNDFLELLIEKSYRIVTVLEISKQKLTVKDEDCYKVTFLVEYSGKKFFISDAWIDRENIQGLWLPSGATAIMPESALGKLLDYYEVSSLQELKDKKLKSFPDKNGFLVLVACDLMKK